MKIELIPDSHLLCAVQLDSVRMKAYQQCVSKGGDSMTSPEVKSQIINQMDKMALPPEAIVRAIAFAIEQPAEVDLMR